MTRSKQFNFTQRGVAGLPDHDPQARAKSTEYSDTAVQGLRLVVGKGGRWFAFRYTLASGRARYARIGTFPALGVAEARAEALEMRAVVDQGRRPPGRARPAEGHAHLRRVLHPGISAFLPAGEALRQGRRVEVPALPEG